MTANLHRYEFKLRSEREKKHVHVLARDCKRRRRQSRTRLSADFSWVNRMRKSVWQATPTLPSVSLMLAQDLDRSEILWRYDKPCWHGDCFTGMLAGMYGAPRRQYYRRTQCVRSHETAFIFKHLLKACVVLRTFPPTFPWNSLGVIRAIPIARWLCAVLMRRYGVRFSFTDWNFESPLTLPPLFEYPVVRKVHVQFGRPY
jgi:hypothetical protein